MENYIEVSKLWWNNLPVGNLNLEKSKTSYFKRYASAFDTTAKDYTQLQDYEICKICITETELFNTPDESQAISYNVLNCFPYQCCPLCNGAGMILADGFTSNAYQTCTVCSGAKIIPMHVKYKTQIWDGLLGLSCHHDFVKKDRMWKSCPHCHTIAPLNS